MSSSKKGYYSFICSHDSHHSLQNRYDSGKLSGTQIQQYLICFPIFLITSLFNMLKTFRAQQRFFFISNRISHQSSYPPFYSLSHNHLKYDDDDATKNDRENVFWRSDGRSSHDFQKQPSSSKQRGFFWNLTIIHRGRVLHPSKNISSNLLFTHQIMLVFEFNTIPTTIKLQVTVSV